MGYENDAEGIEREGGMDPDEEPLNWTDAMHYCIQERIRLGRKFTEGDVRANRGLEEGIVDWLSQLPQDNGFEFLDSCVDLVGQGKSLSDKRISGCLNTLWVAYDRLRREMPTEPTDSISSSVHRSDGMVTPAVPNGFYTVKTSGKSHTFQLAGCTYKNRRPGTQIISLLIGPDNTVNYKGFGFVVGNELEPWSTTRMGPKIEDAARFLLLGNFRIAGHQYALQSKLCYRCRKLLTVEDSIKTGLGPDCAKILGVLYGDLTPPEANYSDIEKELIRKHYPEIQATLDLQAADLPGTKAERLSAMYEKGPKRRFYGPSAVDTSDGLEYEEYAEEDDDGDGIEWRYDGTDAED